MSLQGSLETFALPDVLVLLASTKKDGELHVTGASREGRVWVEKGQIVHSTVNGTETGSVDAVFELLRLSAGEFSFVGDQTPPSRHDPETIDLVLADAQERLSEWREIAKVVPHLGVLVEMSADAPSDEVVITAAQWRMLRTFAAGATVARLMEAEHLDEFDGCRAVKELFEANLVNLDLSAPAPAPPRAAPKPVADRKPASRPEPADEDTADEVEETPRRRPIAARSDADPGDGGRNADAAPVQPAASRPTTAAAKHDALRADLDSQIAALVDEAAQAPRKVRASTVEPDAGERDTDSRPAPTQAADEDKAPEDTKAFVAKLAALEGENEEKLAKRVEEHLARGGELPEVGEGDEPINRGLLLKFLSSVRN